MSSIFVYNLTVRNGIRRRREADSCLLAAAIRSMNSSSGLSLAAFPLAAFQLAALACAPVRPTFFGKLVRAMLLTNGARPGAWRRRDEFTTVQEKSGRRPNGLPRAGASKLGHARD